jgi:hypothetical protein
MDSGIEKLFFKPIAALAIIGIFLWFAIKIFAWFERKFNKSSFFPYAKKNQFFSAEERRFYDALIEAVGPEFIVLSKCRVIDLLDVDMQKQFRAFNRIKFLQVDFVVVRKGNGEVACAIELEGDLSERFGKESLFVDDAFSAAGLPLVRFTVQPVYSVFEIQKALLLSL